MIINAFKRHYSEVKINKYNKLKSKNKQKNGKIAHLVKLSGFCGPVWQQMLQPHDLVLIYLVLDNKG